jgi:hypothetical protein
MTRLTWQIREVLETLLRGDLFVTKKTVDGDANVRSIMVAMWRGGLVAWTEEASGWVFRIAADGRAALATRDSEMVRRAACCAEALPQ